MKFFQVLSFVLVLAAAGAARSRQPSTSTSSDCDSKGCSHGCETVGEFPLCVCPQEMKLDADGKTCKDTTSFLVAMYRGVKQYSEESEETVVVPRKVGCLDYHYRRKEVYAYTNYTIMRFPLTKGEAASPVSLVTRTDTAVTSLAVDWVHDVIYYISEQESALGVTSLGGGEQKTVLAHNGSATVGWQSLVVDPYVKKLFWVGNKGVYSSGLEGEDLMEEMMGWMKPDKIALDTSKQEIYAIGRRGSSSNKFITRATYNGTKVGEDIEVTQPATAGIFGFGVVGNTAYWQSNLDGENIFKCNLLGVGGAEKATATYAIELNQIVYDMKVYDKSVQKSTK